LWWPLLRVLLLVVVSRLVQQLLLLLLGLLLRMTRLRRLLAEVLHGCACTAALP
jgi:hypothetical protein